MKQLDLVTTQNVVIEYPAATVMERIIAAFIDFVIFGIIVWFVIYILGEVMNTYRVDDIGWHFVMLVPILLLITYHTLSEYLANGQSVGKKILGIRVIRMDGQKAGLRESLIRAMMLIVDFVFSGGLIGILAITTSRRHQRLGDMAANTFVIKSNPSKPFRLEDINKIKSLEDYEAVYPAVIQFTENDILQVKETLKRFQKYKNPSHREAFKMMTNKVGAALELEQIPKDRVKFVKTIIRDYIVLTR